MNTSQVLIEFLQSSAVPPYLVIQPQSSIDSTEGILISNQLFYTIFFEFLVNNHRNKYNLTIQQKY